MMLFDIGVRGLCPTDLKAADGVTVNGRKVETSVGQTTKTFFHREIDFLNNKIRTFVTLFKFRYESFFCYKFILRNN